MGDVLSPIRNTRQDSMHIFMDPIQVRSNSGVSSHFVSNGTSLHAWNNSNQNGLIKIEIGVKWTWNKEMKLMFRKDLIEARGFVMLASFIALALSVLQNASFGTNPSLVSAISVSKNLQVLLGQRPWIRSKGHWRNAPTSEVKRKTILKDGKWFRAIVDVLGGKLTKVFLLFCQIWSKERKYHLDENKQLNHAYS